MKLELNHQPQKNSKDFTAHILCHLRALEGPADKLIGPVYHDEFQSYMKRFLAHLEF